MPKEATLEVMSKILTVTDFSDDMSRNKYLGLLSTSWLRIGFFSLIWKMGSGRKLKPKLSHNTASHLFALIFEMLDGPALWVIQGGGSVH